MLKWGTGPDNSFTQDIAIDLFQYDPVHKLVEALGVEPRSAKVQNQCLRLYPVIKKVHQNSAQQERASFMAIPHKFNFIDMGKSL
jgi:hypothetical protein